jgi:hypothetical protein
MTRTAALIIVALFLPCLAFAQQPKQQKVTPLKIRIPPAKPNQYRSVTDAPEWKNPYLIVRADGIEVRVNGAAVNGPTLLVSAVIGFLEKFPNRAWSYGLVVAVQENSIQSGDQHSRIKGNTSELLRSLREAGVKVELWPS